MYKVADTKRGKRNYTKLQPITVYRYWDTIIKPKI